MMDCMMMGDMGAGMMWAMGLVGLLGLATLGLAAAALAKYVFWGGP